MPLRLEIGPRDLESKQTVMARRDTGEKIDVPEVDITSTVLDLLEKIQVRALFSVLSFARSFVVNDPRTNGITYSPFFYLAQRECREAFSCPERRQAGSS